MVQILNLSSLVAFEKLFTLDDHYPPLPTMQFAESLQFLEL